MKTIIIVSLIAVALIAIAAIFTIQSAYADLEICQEQPPIVTTKVTDKSVIISWTAAFQCDGDELVSPKHYVIEKVWVPEQVRTNELSILIEGLEAETEYEFKVIAGYKQLRNQFVSVTVTTDATSVIIEEPEKPNGGGCSDCTPPTLAYDSKGDKKVNNGVCINNSCIDGGYFHTDFPLQRTLAFFPNTVSTVYYENQGPSNIELVQLGIGSPKVGASISSSQAIIEVYLNNFKDDIYNPSIKEIRIIDPDGLLYIASAQIELVPCMDDEIDSCLKTDFKYSYAKAPSSTVLVSNAIDYSKNTFNNYFNDGLEVIYYTPPPVEALSEPKECIISTVLDRNNPCQFLPLIEFEIQRARNVL